MCGIGGVWTFDGTAPAPDVLQRMLATLAHRGPDGRGTWSDGPLALAHTRLSIIDPGGSEQPMDDGDSVRAGQRIARVGDTGSAEGPRLYFEVRYQGRAEDPQAWLRRRP